MGTAALVGLAFAVLVLAARWAGRRRAAERTWTPAEPSVTTPVRLADPSGRRGRGGDGIVG